MKNTITTSILILISTSICNSQILSAGIYYSTFKCSNGGAMSCGTNIQGQLGIGTNTTQINPTQISNLTNIKKISAGGNHTLFLLNDSTVWACGYDAFQQLGDGNTQNSNVPIQSTTVNSVKTLDVSAGQYHSLVLNKNHTVFAFGQNSSGQLGRGNTTNDYATSLVPNLNNVVAVSAGYSHSLFLKADGTVWSCGSNVYGELGIGGTNNSNQLNLVQVSGLTNIIAIAAGKSNTCHSLFLKNDGTVWACGYNANGQLGDGTTTNRFAPVQVSGLSNVILIKAGTGHSLFLKNDGTVWACGENQYGQAGNGAITADVLTPIQASQFAGVSEIAAGNGFSLFLKNNGTVWACGKNNNGNLGDGTQTNRTIPVQLTNICNVLSVNEEDETVEYLKIYPNPVTNNVTIKLQGINGTKELEVVNITGEIIYKNSIDTDTINIDVSTLSKGIYIFKIRNGNKLIVRKIIKE